jgi:arylsulfatase A-like enzyme
MEPDGFAHAGNLEYYLRGIARDDKYVGELYDFLQKSKAYRNPTALLITNDHGRHLDGIDGGFVDHGDGCEGCRHISLLAIGPDFKKGRTLTEIYTQPDVPSTVAYLLGFPLEQSQGKVIKDLLKP